MSLGALAPAHATAAKDATVAPTPIKVLVVSGGCCHNYPAQRELIKQGLEQRINATVSHLFYDPKPGEQATRPALPIYGNPRYADGYDVVIHNECAADESSPERLDAVLAPHRAGTPAVNLHCAMHSYRSGDWRQAVKPDAANARWFEFTGIQSTGHGPQSPVHLAMAGAAHPISAGFVPFVTANEELYNNLTAFDVTPVLTGTQPEAVNPAERSARYNVAWTHRYGPTRARVFSLTLAHNEAGVADGRYLDLVARGVLWATGRLDDKGAVQPGYGRGQGPGR